MYKAELIMDALGEIEAMNAVVNGTAKKRRRRKATIDNTPKIANEAIEVESCIGNLETLESMSVIKQPRQEVHQFKAWHLNFVSNLVGMNTGDLFAVYSHGKKMFRSCLEKPTSFR